MLWTRKNRYPTAAPPTCARWAMPSDGMRKEKNTSSPIRIVTRVRARISIGMGKTTSSASGQYVANASATPSTAPEAPTKGLTVIRPDSPSANTAAPAPQSR
jgi:hypothetical protein